MQGVQAAMGFDGNRKVIWHLHVCEHLEAHLAPGERGVAGIQDAIGKPQDICSAGSGDAFKFSSFTIAEVSPSTRSRSESRPRSLFRATHEYLAADA